MKTLQIFSARISSLVFFYFFCNAGLFAQSSDENDRLGLPGDNFNLAAAMDVFQQSKTLEEFEQRINSDSLKLNNLDLNNDGQTDYIKVMDNVDGNLHSIVLQTDISQTESQDIAVFYVDKKDDKVTVQAIGDEELYGKDYVIEPNTEKNAAGTPNPGYAGNDVKEVNNYTTNNYYTTENYGVPQSYSPHPSSWLIVGFFYGPAYVRWHSPWHWGYYPRWWRPWRPFYWNDYYSHWYHHHAWNGWWYHHPHHFYFHNHWRNTYYGRRAHSATVARNRASGSYNRSYSNPDKVSRPATKPNFPALDSRPVKQQNNVSRPVKSESGQVVKPGNRNDNAVKPSKPGRDQSTKPAVKKQREPVRKDPKIKPANKPRNNKNTGNRNTPRN